MNHLPLPKNPAYAPIEVPYHGLQYHEDKCVHDANGNLCDSCTAHGFRGWHHFPDRLGWKTSDIARNIFSSSDDEHSSVATIAMLQAWLWFGTLSVFLGQLEGANADNFVSSKEDEPETVLIDTSALPELLSQWEQWLHALSVQEKEIYLQNVRYVLQETSAFCLTHFGERASITSKCPLPQEVQLSIAVLGRTLSHAVCVVTDDLRNIGSFGSCNLMLQRLRDNSWCPNDTVLGRGSVAYFAMMMGTRSCEPKFSHSDCHENVCHEADIDQSSYITKHITENCDCEHFSPPTDLFLRVIDQWKMPLIACLSRKMADPTYRKAREEAFGGDVSALGYVAISHVWADGLGNPTANSLPLCQVATIQNHVNALYGIQGQYDICVPFFMDTLCIPVPNPSTDEYGLWELVRKVTISWMSQVYSEASRVLVLDADIQKSCSSGTDVVELLLRLATSRWAHRLWTLHEALRSKIIFIQLYDGAVRLADIMDELYKRLDERRLWDPITYEVSLWAENLSRLRSVIGPENSDERSSEKRIINAFVCASNRSTSHKEDEIIILALLAGFDRAQMKTLQEQPRSTAESYNSSNQAVQFLETMGKIPKQLLLTPGLRCNQEGRRACPSALLEAWRATPGGPNFSEFHEIVRLGVQGPWEGFWIKSSVVEYFDIDGWPRAENVVALEGVSVFTFPIKDATKGVWLQVGILSHLPSRDIVEACFRKHLAILLDSHDTADAGRLTAGMLVSVEDYPPVQEGSEDVMEIIRAHWVANTVLTPIDEDSQKAWEFGSTVSTFDQPTGQRIRSGQIWCID